MFDNLKRVLQAHKNGTPITDPETLAAADTELELVLAGGYEAMAAAGIERIQLHVTVKDSEGNVKEHKCLADTAGQG